jgi:hypothetical protein
MTPKLDREKVYAAFSKTVNMTADEIEGWLKTTQSRAVGWKGKGGGARESVGHASGRRIVQILRTSRDAITDEDYSHMRKVVGYVRRHLAQRPENIFTSRWRYSLMNWGHDPVKEDEL